MFLSQPLLDVLVRRDIRDIDEFLRQPSFSDLADPFSIPNLRTAVDRVSLAIKEHKRIAVFGDYDCDGVLASHILQAGLQRFGAKVRVCKQWGHPFRGRFVGGVQPAPFAWSGGPTSFLPKSSWASHPGKSSACFKEGGDGDSVLIARIIIEASWNKP